MKLMKKTNQILFQNICKIYKLLTSITQEEKEKEKRYDLLI